MVPSREERKKRLTEQRTGQILDAALAVFSLRGYDRATVPDIAREAGVSVGTIYNYFPGKRDILTALMEHHIINPILGFISPAGPAEDESVLSSIIENRLVFGVTRADTFIPVFLETQRDAGLRQQYRETLLKPMLQQADRFVSEIIARGNFRDYPPELITRLITALLIGIAVLTRTEGADSPLRAMNPKQLAADISRILLDGLKKP